MKGISYIICCYNSEKVITEPIKAILNQATSVNYEIIVIDNNCTDNTENLIKTIYKDSNSSINLKIVKEKQAGLLWARKKGFLLSNYDYICYIDDDNIIDKNWTNIVFETFNNNSEIGILGGNNKEVFVDSVKHPPKWFNNVKAGYACSSQGKKLENVTLKRMFVYGAGLCIRKETLQDVYDLPIPLYLTGRKKDLLLSGDDSEICMRAILLGYKIFYNEEMVLEHIMIKERLTWSYYSKMREGHAASSTILRIYKSLIRGDKPLNLYKTIYFISKKWFEYFHKFKYKDRLKVDSKASKLYIDNVGRTRGMIYFIFKYNKIYKEICNTFRVNGNFK